MKKIQYLLLVRVFCAPHAALYAQTAAGMGQRPISVSALQERILSLSPGLTEILLQALGFIEDCHPLEPANQTKASGFSSSRLSEEIAALKPNLLLDSEDLRRRIIALVDTRGIRAFLVMASGVQLDTSCESTGWFTRHESGAACVRAAMRVKITQAQLGWIPAAVIMEPPALPQAQGVYDALVNADTVPTISILL